LTSPPSSDFQKPTSQVVSNSCNTANSDTEERALHRKIIRHPLGEYVIDSGHSSPDAFFASVNAEFIGALSCPQPYLLFGAAPLACVNPLIASAWTSRAIALSAVTADTTLQPVFVGCESTVSAWRYHYPSLPAEINRH